MKTKSSVSATHTDLYRQFTFQFDRSSIFSDLIVVKYNINHTLAYSTSRNHINVLIGMHLFLFNDISQKI